MVTEGNSSSKSHSAIAAKDRVRIGPLPDWVVTCPFDPLFRAEHPGPTTYLLINQQVHAEARQSYFHTAVRLETMESVQRESQWRLEFEPRTQSVIIHSIKVRRGESVFDQCNYERIRFLQRESGLEGFVIDGWSTLLLLLEDVRLGDTLEWSFTIETVPRLLPEHFNIFFTLPLKTPVGKYQFSLQFNKGRKAKWKSSSEKLSPVETCENERLSWIWAGEKFAMSEPEEGIPNWYIPYPWIQVSDCPDWNKFATAVASAWNEDDEDTTLEELAKQIADKETDLAMRVEKALQLVQDEFRYLSVNIELGGQVPTPPGVVARRRFGDCKDLSFLLVTLLRRLGIAARPILVNATLCKSVAGLLPPGLFNHVVVEYQLQGTTRWVDPTIKRQGGGSLNRFIPEFGVGLPVDATASNLIEAPRAAANVNYYEQRESILLDTTGDVSYLSIVVTARGYHAELLRHEFEVEGVESVAKKRLQSCANRFAKATRIGSFQHRDDRLINEFVIAEVFEIQGFLVADPQPGICQCFIPNDLVIGILKLPGASTRKTPFALPYPCNVVHIVEVQSPALGISPMPPFRRESPFIEFRRSHKSLSGYWSVTFQFKTLNDAVLPESITEHRKIIEEIWRESGWLLRLPLGVSSPRRRRDFGELPPPLKESRPLPAANQSKPVTTPIPPSSPAATSMEDWRLVDAGSPRPRNLPQRHTRAGMELPRHSSRGHRQKKLRPVWKALIITSILFLACILFLLWVSLAASHSRR